MGRIMGGGGGGGGVGNVTLLFEISQIKSAGDL